MKQQEKSVQLKSPNPLQVEEEHVSKTDRKEAQKEQKRAGQAVAKTNEIEMEQKERGNGDITTEVKEGGTEGDVDDYYFEDPSNIGIVACSHMCHANFLFTYKSLHLFLKCLVTMPFQ